MEIVNVSVRLRRVTKDDAQDALHAMEDIFDEYERHHQLILGLGELPDETRLELWEHYQTFASDVLIRFGEFNPDVGYSEQNGQG